ncbi:methyl-accepting chemotaxis protein [Aciduricibacillus chroicocephali]|uniref:Methyl-accepting chemotaxis protein n=1 Tax=Aciduricibacillus chroicocephali TaxID=3054939 RepID=A0ABY9KSP9_9BACI|nr:methyl-accepting chemotaxis protein [Bacillaceae bacterium 44XB]
MKWTIRKKLVLISLILLALPTMIIGYFGYTGAKKGLDEQGTKGLKNNVILAEKLITVLNEEVKAGKLTLEEAQERARVMLIGKKQGDGKRSIDSKVDMGENGYFFALDDQGVAVAHPMKEGESLIDSQTPDGVYSTQEIIKRANSGGGFIEFEFEMPGGKEIAPKIVYADKEKNWGWIITSGSYMKEFNSEATKVLTTTLIVLLSALTIGIIFIFWFAGKIANPILVITKQVEKLAKGDLKTEEVSIKSNDEVGELSRYFNEMAGNLKTMILSVSEASHQVAGTSEQLSASSEETAKLVQHVAESVQEIASSAEGQVNRSSSSSNAAKNISTHINDIVMIVEDVSLASRQTADGAENGNEIITATVDHMTTVQEHTAGLSGIVNGLGSKSKEIGKIVSMITSVAEQTNLLALNASIEAARAGEQGKGFAVVANEVRKLAEQSADAAQQISSLIEAIQVDIDKSVVAMHEGESSVDEGLKLVNEAGDAFRDIVQAVRHVSDQVEEVSGAVLEMSKETKEMESLIEESEHTTDVAADYTQQIAAAAQEQSASVEEITTVSNMLSEMAQQLQESISDFKM